MDIGFGQGPSVGTPMIVADGLAKHFGQAVAVHDVTLRVRQGEVLALLGPNGAGKTTTVRMLASIIKPTAGRATVAGLDIVTNAEQVRGTVGLLTEFPGLYKRMRAVEYLDFYGQLQGLSPAVRRERIESLLHRFDLWETRGYQLGHYSKGMAQKLALIRAMLHDPTVLFLDEPTSAMDPHSARLVRTTIQWLRDQGKTIVLCTHNLTEAQELADRIAIIRAGEVIALGTLDELRARYLPHSAYELRLAHGRDGLHHLVEPYARVVARGDDWLCYETDDGLATNPRVLDALYRAGAQVLTLTLLAGGLEDVYLSLISGSGVEVAGDAHGATGLSL